MRNSWKHRLIRIAVIWMAVLILLPGIIAAEMPERQRRPSLVNVPVSVSAPAGQTARFVELEIKPFGWAFVTEVLVD